MILTFKVDEVIKVKDFLQNKITARLLKTLSTSDVSYIVNNQNVKNYFLMKPNDELKIIIPSTPSEVIATKGELDILYEDDYLLIINKPNNIASIPTRIHYTSSLANIVQYYYVTKGIDSGIHFVNRLDAPTSGIIIVAKNTYIADKMKNCILEKKYLLKVHGEILEDGFVKTKIIKDENSIIKRKNVEGDSSYTTFKVLEHFKDTTLIEATLHTGKTHQLRLHFDYLGHNIIGDKLYGNDGEELLYLHSYYLKFIHPITNETKEIKSLPNWLSQ